MGIGIVSLSKVSESICCFSLGASVGPGIMACGYLMPGLIFAGLLPYCLAAGWNRSCWFIVAVVVQR